MWNVKYKLMKGLKWVKHKGLKSKTLTDGQYRIQKSLYIKCKTFS